MRRLTCVRFARPETLSPHTARTQARARQCESRDACRTTFVLCCSGWHVRVASQSLFRAERNRSHRVLIALWRTGEVINIHTRKYTMIWNSELCAFRLKTVQWPIQFTAIHIIMSNMCVNVMWRLSDDFNRRFVARVHEQQQHQQHHLYSRQIPMILNGMGAGCFYDKVLFHLSKN